MKEKPVRLKTLANKTVIIDGQSGTGKSMLAYIVSTFDRVENFQYAPALEHVLEMCYLGHVTKEGAMAFTKLTTDMLLYNQIQGRNMNVRPSDLSSIWNNPRKWSYLKRLISKGDMAIPKKIHSSNPILHIETHHLLAVSHPLVEALYGKVLFVEVVRHPLYCLKQQAINWDRLTNNSRNFNLHVSYNNVQVPFTFAGFESLFIQSNSVEKAIYEMHLLKRLHMNVGEKISDHTITIPFEKFIKFPKADVLLIADRLSTEPTNDTWLEMERQKVPRKLSTAGKDTRIFRRVGWEKPGKKDTEEMEYIKLWNWARSNADQSAISTLEQLCNDYEEKWNLKFSQ